MSSTQQITDIPSTLHGLIIGPQGSILKQIQQASGATIQLPRKEETNNQTIVITGASVTAVTKAKELIYEKVAGKLAKKFKQEYNVPSNVTKYIIGDKGANLKQCETASNCKIVINQGTGSTSTFEIQGDNEQQATLCFDKILEVLEEYSWFWDTKKKIFYEDSELQKFVDKAMAKVNEQAKLRGEAYEKSKKAFESNQKALAKELSDKGKEHQALMEKYQKEASKQIFDHVNAKHGASPLIIDLHGLHVQDALDFVKERIAKLKKEKKTGVLNVIPGAGNHSEGGSAKIKPALVTYLNAENLKYQQVRNGQFDITL